MSYLLEMLAKGLESNVGETLSKYLRAAAGKSMEELHARAKAQPNDAQAQFQLGLAFLRGMDFAQAITCLNGAARIDPDHLLARLALAAAHDELGQSDHALAQLGLANQLHPGTPLAIFAMGYCLEKLSRSKEAVELYGDVLKRDADHVPARQRLAAIALLTDDPSGAVAQYEHLCRLSPGDNSARATLAHLYFRCGRFAQAIAEFETVIAMEPDNWALVDEEVEVLVKSGHVREAIERLYKLLSAQGPFPDLHMRVADLFSGMGQDAQATEHYLAALESDPDYLEARIRLGSHHLSSGRWAEAAEAFHQAGQANDRLLVCYVGLGVSQAAQGNQSEAINTFTLAGAVEPNSDVLLSEVARLQLKAALAEEFQRNFEPRANPPLAEPDLDNDDLLVAQLRRHAQYVAEHPQYADVRYRYGVLLRAEGWLAEALEQFAAAVEINPNYVDALIRLGLTQQELGRLDDAVDTFRKTLELQPRYVDLHYRLALLHTDRRQFEQAVRHMEQAAGLAPNNPQVRAGLALSLVNTGLLDAAVATWRSLQAMPPANNATPDSLPPQR